MYSSVIIARSAFTATPTRPPAFNKKLWEQVVLQTKSAAALTACLPRSVVLEPPSHVISLPGFIWLLALGYSEVRRPADSSSLHFAHDDLGMIGTLFLLFSIHGRQREDEREKRLQYWREQVRRIFSYTTGEQLVLTNITIYQNSFRQNILQMHETAQASVFVNPASSSRRSAQFGTATEDSHAPILQYDVVGSERPWGTDEGSYEDGYETSENLFTRTPFTHDNKI